MCMPLQELDAHAGVIWAAAFNRAGRHLATGGQDAVVRLWAVLPDRSTPQVQTPYVELCPRNGGLLEAWRTAEGTVSRPGKQIGRRSRAPDPAV